MKFLDEEELWLEDRGDDYSFAAGLAVALMAISALAAFQVGKKLLPRLWQGAKQLGRWLLPQLKLLWERARRWLLPRLRGLLLRIAQGVCGLLARLRRAPSRPV